MAFVLLSGLAQAAEATAPYLAKVGPAALRFQSALRPVVPLALPPLAMADPAPVVAAPRVQPAPEPPPVQAPSGAQEALPNLWESLQSDLVSPAPDPVEAVPPPAPAPAAVLGEPPLANVTPQMLVKFFNQQAGSSNRVGGEFLAPPGFFKPAIPPGGGASSTATYTTPK